MPALSANYQTVSFLKKRFEEVGLSLKARYGQNFLIDLNLLRLLAETADVQPNDVVLEVGTGTGSLTAILAAQAAEVVSVEIDPQLHQLASEELIDFDNVLLLQTDALRRKNTLNPEVLDAVNNRLAERPDRRFVLAANLPYCIATPVISNLLALDRPPELMTVTIQRELAERFIAVPGTKDYSSASIWIQSQCRVQLVRLLPPEVFWPRPKITSAIVQIRLDPSLRSRIADLPFFHDFVRTIFLHRRKLLRGGLLAGYKSRLDKPAIDALLAEQGLIPTCRAEELTSPAILALADAVRARLQ
jgi:16S rRNA (adenine1518-N6/adenine1519-N6)-dimethyltransferase